MTAALARISSMAARITGFARVSSGSSRPVRPRIRGLDEHRRRRGVHQADADLAAVGERHRVHHVPRRQERARLRARGVHEVHDDARTGAGHAVHDEVALDTRAAVVHGHVRLEYLRGVRVEDADAGNGFDDWHEPLVDRKRPDRLRDVAAVALVVDVGLVERHVPDGVVDVGVRSRRTADDGDLARERIGPAEAVDLTGIRAAERGEDHPVPDGRTGRQVRCEKEDRFAGASPDDGGADSLVLTHHARPLQAHQHTGLVTMERPAPRRKAWITL